MRKEAERRRATDGIVIFSVEMFEKTGCTPTTTKDDDRLFVGVEWELWAGMAFLVGDVIERAGRWEELDAHLERGEQD